MSLNIFCNSCSFYVMHSLAVSRRDGSQSDCLQQLDTAAGGSAQRNGHFCSLMHDSVDHWQSSVVVLVLQHEQPSNALSWALFDASGGLSSGTNSLLPPPASQLPSIYTCATPLAALGKCHWVPSILSQEICSP